MRYINKKSIDLKRYSIARVKSSREMKPMLSGFNSDKNLSMAGYVQRQAWGEDNKNIRANYVVKEGNRIVLFFSLQCGILVKCHKKIIGGIRHNESSNGEEEYFIDEDKINVTKVIPAIEMAHYCINDSYLRRKIETNITVGFEEYSIGSYIFYEYIAPIIKEVAQKIGVRYLYLFCADDGSGKLKDYYEKVLHFKIMDDMACVRSSYEKDLECMIISIECLDLDRGRFEDLKNYKKVIEYVNEHGLISEAQAKEKLQIYDPTYLFEKLINQELVAPLLPIKENIPIRAVKKVNKHNK